jgi:DNA-binding CsgD family transcriptional regulator
MEFSPVLGFFIGFISSIGYYRLFFSINRPTVRWRFVVMLIVVIISRPICVSWQIQYAGVQGYALFPVLVSVFINFISLFACALLGPNRKRALIASAFIFFVIYSATEMFVIFLIASFTYPLLNSNNAMHITFGMPQFRYAAVFLFNLIVMCHCFLAARWIRKIPEPAAEAKGRGSPPENTPVKSCVLFCLILLSYSVTTTFWSLMTTTRMPPVSFFPSTLLGALLMCIPIFSLYFFTRLAPRTKPIPANEKENENTAYQAHAEYAQFIGQLSKRELEVISAVLAGSYRYKTLASSLNISVNTVKTHLQHIYQITGANNIEALSALFTGYSPARSETIPKSP